MSKRTSRRPGRSPATRVADAKTTAWGPQIGTLRQLTLGGKTYTPYARPFALFTNRVGNALLIRHVGFSGHVVYPTRALRRLTRVEYDHVQGGRYHHTFSRRAVARQTREGIVVTGIKIKPFIEG